MTEYVMEYDGWAEGIPLGEYLKVRDAMHARKREEIVRCRDCKHVSPDGRWCYKPLGCSSAEELPVKPDSFCAWGERK